jgi:uncharacterized protein (DUF885 family)
VRDFSRCLVLVLALLVLGTFTVHAQTQDTTPDVTLKALLDEDLAASLRRNPLQATVRGIPGYGHLLPDLSLAELRREQARERRALERLRALDLKALRDQDKVSYQLLRDKLELAVEAQQFTDAEALVLSTLGGLQNVLPRAAQVTPFKTADDYRDYVKRIRAMPKLVDDTIERLKPGLASGWMSSKPVLDRVVAAIDAHLVENIDTSPLLSPFTRKADAVAAADLEPIRADARRAVADDYQPALRRFKAFVADGYRPKAPEEAGVASYPGGARYYEFLIRARIVRGLSAQQIHALGQAEVKRLRGEIGEVAKGMGFAGTTDQFIEHMRTDRKFFFDSADEVLAAYRAMSTRVDPSLPKLFHTVPRMRYAVRAMTPAEAASSTAANYQVGSLALGTSGYFTINALGYESEARWRVETLFLHEAVPGHHMQIARAAEIEGLHPWRSQGELQHRLRRGLGALCGVAGLRSWILQGSRAALRQSAGAALPRGTAGRRHRYPREPVAARQGDRLHGNRRRRRPQLRDQRGGPLLLEPDAGAGLSPRIPQDARASRQGRSVARRPLRCQGLPLTRDRQRLDAARRARAEGRRVDRAGRRREQAMKISAQMTVVMAAIFAVICYGVAITGFLSLGDIADATQKSDAKGFAWFWAFLGAVATVFGLLARWIVRTQKDDL